jgi:hypothetical protein
MAGFTKDEKDTAEYPLMRKMQRMLDARGSLTIEKVKMFCALKYPSWQQNDNMTGMAPASLKIMDHVGQKQMQTDQHDD